VNISPFVYHVTAGIKILNLHAIYPISRHLPIGLEGSKKVQSRDLYFPLILTRDTKTLYQVQFKDIFDFSAG
jgi:hypothetical protein